MCSMDSVIATKFHQPPLISLHNGRTILVKPISLLSMRNPTNPENPKPIFEPFPFSLLKTTFIAAVATTSLYFSRLNPAIAVHVSALPAIPESNLERNLEYRLKFFPNDVDALKGLVYRRLLNNTIDKTIISVIDTLIGLEPEESEWKLVKSDFYFNDKDFESARVMYELLIKEHPFCVKAYNGLVAASAPEFNKTKALIEEGMRLAKKRNKVDALRELRLVLAKTYVSEGNYDEALNVYNDLVKEQPRDFRPYACMGAIYTWLRKNSEANQCFEKYKCYMPKGHEDINYHNIMMNAKLYVEKQDRDLGNP